MGPTEGEILYDSAYTRYIEAANPQRQKAEQGLPGARETGNEKLLFNAHAEFQFGIIKTLWR